MKQVSVIIPCYNEQGTIEFLLKAIYEQSYCRTQMEVVIADGLSSDLTINKINEFTIKHPDLEIRLIENPDRNIPSGLNRAMAEAQGQYFIRLDGHSVPDKNYVSKCVENLELGKGDSVGGIWIISPRGSSWQAKSIALAAAHPLGVGDAKYRIGGKAQEVDTVPFGAFQKKLISKIGGFDETLLANEDYEFNARIRRSGGKIWFDPEIRSRYYASSSFSTLSRQYARYGFWKARMLRVHPGTIRWRQFLPPVFIISLLFFIIGGLFWPILWSFLVIELNAYLLILILTGVFLAVKKKDLILILGIPIAIATMHLSWGSAFIWSLIKPSLK